MHCARDWPGERPWRARCTAHARSGCMLACAHEFHLQAGSLGLPLNARTDGHQRACIPLRRRPAIAATSAQACAFDGTGSQHRCQASGMSATAHRRRRRTMHGRAEDPYASVAQQRCVGLRFCTAFAPLRQCCSCGLLLSNAACWHAGKQTNSWPRRWRCRLDAASGQASHRLPSRSQLCSGRAMCMRKRFTQSGECWRYPPTRAACAARHPAPPPCCRMCTGQHAFTRCAHATDRKIAELRERIMKQRQQIGGVNAPQENNEVRRARSVHAAHVAQPPCARCVAAAVSVLAAGGKTDPCAGEQSGKGSRQRYVHPHRRAHKAAVQAVVKYNQTLAENKRLKEDINGLRRERGPLRPLE